MRLDKLLANMGVGSRKEVRQLLKAKKVTLNGKIIKDASEKVNPDKDKVCVDGEPIIYQEFIYLMLHKPPGVVSATVDAKDKTVIDLLSEQDRRFQPFPVGRLDKDTEGLLLVTNDGDLAHQLTSPKKDVPKMYRAKVKGDLPYDIVQQFAEGITLDDGYHTKPAKLKILSPKDESGISEIEIEITEGKFHQIKRMFEAVNGKVIYLKRHRMGNLELDSQLPIGTYRPLTEEELAYCFSLRAR
ncbi:pseudouridine synthase [Oceanobacillus sp. J11TS1]|uniref:pseudouridine synthase n=1 Tax=Oceanobacillus sp. J11TS1 TaxID=2807191 RepID=UPI001AFF3C4C|nr:pseudouridine synthase [Oceanobacillus sp. J11TS1]GIO24992.1 pseudouridine synthase [Oceanobacillus sp. J11TS1]